MQTITFALRTSDQAWIKRNNAVIGDAGRVFVQVPASEVEKTTFCGQPMLRHRFADVPADAGNAAIVCPAAWVPESAERLAGNAAVDDGFRAREAAERFLASIGR